MAQEQQLSQPSVQQAPMPGVKLQADASPASFGGGAATEGAFQASTDLANSAADLFYQRAQRKQQLQDLQTNYAMNGQLAELKTNLLYDPKTGALNQHGDNANGITGKTLDVWNKAVTDLGRNFTTPQQMEAFQRAVGSNQVELHRELDKHEYGEAVATTTNTITSAAAKFADAAEKSALTDPAATQMNLRRTQASLGELADLKGLSGVSREQFINTQMSANHMRVLSTLIDAQQDLKAEQYFKDHQQDFYGNDYKNAVAATQKASVLGESYRLMDLITAPQDKARDFANDNEAGSGQVTPTRAEARAKVKDVTDNPKVRLLLTKMIDEKYDQEETDQRQSIHDNYIKASKAIYDSRVVGSNAPIETRIPQSVLDEIAKSPEHIKSLNDYAVALSFDRQSDPEAKAKFINAVSDTAGLGKQSWSDVAMNIGKGLSQTDYGQLQKEWEKAHDSYLKNQATPVPDAQITRATNEALGSFTRGIPWYEPGANQPFKDVEQGIHNLKGEALNRYNLFHQSVQYDAEVEKNAKGRPLNTIEIQAVINRNLQNQVEYYREGTASSVLGESRKLPASMLLPREHVNLSDDERRFFVSKINELRGAKMDWTAIPADDSRLQRMKKALLANRADLVDRIATE